MNAGLVNYAGGQYGGNIILTTGRNYWSIVNHFGLHGDIIFRGGTSQGYTDIYEHARMNGTNGYWGFGTNAPTARLDVVGIVKTTGLQLTTGATLEVYGTAKIGKSGTNLTGIVKRTVPLPATNFAANANAGISFAYDGAATGGTVMVSPSAPLPAGLVIAFAWVSSNGNVDVVFRNATGGIIAYPGGTNLIITVVTQ